MRPIDADAIPWFIEGIGEIPVVTREEIDEMPTLIVDSVPVRHGRWVEEVTDDGKGFPRTEYTCPFCQYKTRADTNYCPECGARLKEYE